MSSPTYLELFVELLKTLPSDFLREMDLVRRLDKMAEDTKGTLALKGSALLKDFQGTRRIGPDETGGLLQLMMDRREAEMKCQLLTLEKITVLDQAITTILSYVAKLDDDLRRYRETLHPDELEVAINEESRIISMRNRAELQQSMYTSMMQQQHYHDMSRSRSASGSSMMGSGIGGGLTSSRSGGGGGGGGGGGSSSASRHEDMVVDESQVTYCFCGRTSDNDNDVMIGCDSSSCKIQWFHLSCVGLKKAPVGKWYCDACTARRQR